MSSLTRLQACKEIRRKSLITYICGEQILYNGKIHRFSIELFLHKGKIVAVFQSSHNNKSYGIKISSNQLLHFLRKYYSR